MELNWPQSDLIVNQAPLHINRTGNGQLPALVLVHGFSDNGLCWQDLAQALENRYDVILPDMRGHGKSARVARGETIDMASDLAGLILGLGLNKPIVGGHSMGGAAISRLGALYPDLPGALILEDPGWWTADPAKPRPIRFGEGSPMQAWIGQLQSQTTEQVMADCRAEHPTWSDNVVRRWCEGKQQLDPLFFTVTETGFHDDWRGLARAFRCPTLLVTADVALGAIVTPEIAAEAAALNPLIRAAHIAGAGHHVRFGQPAAYTRAVEQFLASL